MLRYVARGKRPAAETVGPSKRFLNGTPTRRWQARGRRQVPRQRPRPLLPLRPLRRLRPGALFGARRQRHSQEWPAVRRGPVRSGRKMKGRRLTTTAPNLLLHTQVRQRQATIFYHVA